MKFRRYFLIAGVAALFAAGIASCASKQESKEAASDPVPEETAVQSESAEPVVVLEKGQTIAPAEGKLVVIDFNATWCGPCRQFAPHFDAVARNNQDKAVFYSVDVDVHPELAAQYMVESIPMVVYIKPDGTTDSTVGYMDEAQFAAAVAEHLK